MNRTPTRSLNWDSSLVALQRVAGKQVRHEIFHFRMFGCKAYPFLKGKDKFLKSEKMKSRAFIGYLVGYDSFNIFRVWNPDKGDVSDYKNVIFNENDLFDKYKKKRLITESEKKKFVEFHALNFRPVVQLDDEDEEWLNTPIRGRIEYDLGEEASPIDEYDYEDESQSSTPRQQQYSTSRQLATSETTPSMSSDAPGASYIARRIDVDDKPVPIRKPRAVEKKKGKMVEKSIEKRVIFVEFFETGQTLLDITRHKTRSPIPSSDIDEANIIEGKRARRSNPKYANVSWTVEERQKFFVFHMAFMAGTMINQQQIHSNDLPEPPSN